VKKTKKAILSSDSLTFLALSQLAIDIGEVLSQYNWSAFPPRVGKLGERIKLDAQRLEMIAYKLSNVEIEE